MQCITKCSTFFLTSFYQYSCNKRQIDQERNDIRKQNVCNVWNYRRINSHMFFSYLVTSQIWNKSDIWSGINSVHQNCAKEHFSQFHIIGLNKKQNIVWKCMWVAVIRNIWNHKNNYIFRHCKMQKKCLLQHK